MKRRRRALLGRARRDRDSSLRDGRRGAGGRGERGSSDEATYPDLFASWTKKQRPSRGVWWTLHRSRRSLELAPTRSTSAQRRSVRDEAVCPRPRAGRRADRCFHRRCNACVAQRVAQSDARGRRRGRGTARRGEQELPNVPREEECPKESYEIPHTPGARNRR